ncbi:hypothetical protein GCM10027586_02120 [Kineococcus gypseus]|uniref:hypothetical protein n=1 Tax=Kineococcus gypseus TaxID=1637102 RepID=UPI003D7CEDFB
MRLLHLSAVGPGRPTAVVEFAPRLTVIYGASETGKSYVLDAVDFVLGKRELRSVPQDQGYRTMLLGIEFADGAVVTLARELRGGRISVFQEDLRSLPQRPADQVLIGKHNGNNPANISRFLLDELGIAGAQLRKNKRNVLQPMSFRQIAHLVLIDEERMQSVTSPVESGQPIQRPVEWSALKLLLEGQDDSNLVAGEDATAFRRVNRAQLQVLERAVEQFRAQLQGAPDAEEGRQSLTRVNNAIEATSESIAGVLAQRERAVERSRRLRQEQATAQERAAEAGALLGRFSLLAQQYAADLARLQLVKETGTLLGYFDTESCVFCGADTRHQRREHAIYETVQLASAVDAETAKTQALQDDLAETLAGLRAQLLEAEERLLGLAPQLESSIREASDLDQALQPAQTSLHQLIERRSQLEQWSGLWARVGDLEALRASVAQERPTASDAVGHGITSATQQDLSRTLRSVLTQWEVPGASDASFTFTTAPAITMQQRSRESRGKGMRSVLHAAFSIALSEFCTERDLPHPGFVALDTPVLTYRDAEQGSASASEQVVAQSADQLSGTDPLSTQDDELLSGSVARAFYRYLSTIHTGQCIVIENQTPPPVSAPGCATIYFSGSSDSGRSGFYPL